MPSALEDKDAIREVLAQYCFALDDGRFADMAACFAEDGTWHTAFGEATGRKAIAEFAAGLRAHRPGPTPRAIHHVTNVVITLDGDSAKVRSNWTTVQNSPQGPRSARAAPMTTTWSRSAGAGSSATARSTATSGRRTTNERLDGKIQCVSPRLACEHLRMRVADIMPANL